MKKIILSIALLFVSLVGFSQSASDIVSQMKAEEGVEAQVLTKMMLQMQFAQAPDEKIKELGKKIDSMTILSLSKASQETKTKFEELLSKLPENGYEKTLDTEEMGMKSTNYIKKEGDLITEMVNIIDAQGEKVFILVKGKFSEAELEALMNM